MCRVTLTLLYNEGSIGLLKHSRIAANSVWKTEKLNMTVNGIICVSKSQATFYSILPGYDLS